MVVAKTFWSGVLPVNLAILYIVGSGKRITIDLWKMFSQIQTPVGMNLVATINGNQIPMARITFNPGFSLDVLDENQTLKLAAGDSISGQTDMANAVSGFIQGTEESPV